MSTHHAKHRTSAEIDAEIAKFPPLTDNLGCDEIQTEINDDMDNLQHLDELPPRVRASYAAMLRRDIMRLRALAKAQHCK